MTNFYRTPWRERSWLARLCILVGSVAAGVALDYTVSEVLGYGILLANAVVTPDWVVRDAAVNLMNNTVFGAPPNCNRSYDSQYRVNGAAMGFTIQGRLPQRYKPSVGATLTTTPIDDQTVPITITDQTHIGISFSSATLTMEVTEYRKNYIVPAMIALANNIDYTGLSRIYKQAYHTVGTPGVVPGSTGTLPYEPQQVYGAAKVKLDNAAVPTDGRRAILDSNMHMYLATSQSAIFNPATDISEAYRKGEFGRMALGFERWFMDQNVATHTVGALGGTPLVNGAGQSGSSITADGASNNVTNYFREGDVIQLADVYGVNPLNYQTTGQLQDFVVTDDVDSDGSGNLTIPISPSITVAGVRQTVNALPANNAAITTFGHASSYAGVATPQGLMYHPDGVVMAMADLVKPEGVWLSETTRNAKLGVAMRIVKSYNIESDQAPARIDTLHGWKLFRSEFVARVCS